MSSPKQKINADPEESFSTWPALRFQIFVARDKPADCEKQCLGTDEDMSSPDARADSHWSSSVLVQLGVSLLRKRIELSASTCVAPMSEQNRIERVQSGNAGEHIQVGIPSNCSQREPLGAFSSTAYVSSL